MNGGTDFGKLKQHLGGHRFHTEEVEMVLHEWLQMKELEFYNHGIF
jgi:hypothetical protein